MCWTFCWTKCWTLFLSKIRILSAISISSGDRLGKLLGDGAGEGNRTLVFSLEVRHIFKCLHVPFRQNKTFRLTETTTEFCLVGIKLKLGALMKSRFSNLGVMPRSASARRRIDSRSVIPIPRTRSARRPWMSAIWHGHSWLATVGVLEKLPAHRYGARQMLRRLNTENDLRITSGSIPSTMNTRRDL